MTNEKFIINIIERRWDWCWCFMTAVIQVIFHWSLLKPTNGNRHFLIFYSVVGSNWRPYIKSALILLFDTFLETCDLFHDMYYLETNLSLLTQTLNVLLITLWNFQLSMRPHFWKCVRIKALLAGAPVSTRDDHSHQIYLSILLAWYSSERMAD